MAAYELAKKNWKRKGTASDMSAVDTRNTARDSLFLLADIRLDGGDETCRVRVRNLSPGGMMAEGALPVQRGSNVSVNMANIGWVGGSVAWVQGNRFGIAFAKEIDPAMVRGSKDSAPCSSLGVPSYLRSKTVNGADSRVRNV